MPTEMLTESSSRYETEKPAMKNSFLRKHGHKLIALAFWVILLVGYGWYYTSNGHTPTTALAEIAELLNSPYGPILYIIIYTIRPLLFFSAAALTLAAGAIFGAGSPLNLVYAVILTIIASNMSSTVAYYIGRFFGSGVLENNNGENVSKVQKYTNRMRDNSFETIMIMRFIFLPYDMVSYLAGILHIKYVPFIAATALGSIPGTIAFVSFGASVDIADLLADETPEFNPWVLGFGAAIFVVSIAISRYFKAREAARESNSVA